MTKPVVCQRCDVSAEKLFIVKVQLWPRSVFVGSSVPVLHGTVSLAHDWESCAEPLISVIDKDNKSSNITK